MDHRQAFAPVPASAGVARSFVEDQVRACGWAEVVDDATLLTSEIVTNAAIHTQKPFVVKVDCRDRCVRVEVSDHSSEPLQRRQAGPFDVHGRGLAIVDTLATDWGVDEEPDDGKTVWFELAVSDATG